MDNLNTHKEASLYEAFAPEKARALCERFEMHAGCLKLRQLSRAQRDSFLCQIVRLRLVFA